MDPLDYDVRVPSAMTIRQSPTQVIVTVPPMQGSPKIPVLVAGCRPSLLAVPSDGRRMQVDSPPSPRARAAALAMIRLPAPRVLGLSPAVLPTDMCTVLTVYGSSLGIDRTIVLRSAAW